MPTRITSAKKPTTPSSSPVKRGGKASATAVAKVTARITAAAAAKPAPVAKPLPKETLSLIEPKVRKKRSDSDAPVATKSIIQRISAKPKVAKVEPPVEPEPIPPVVEAPPVAEIVEIAEVVEPAVEEPAEKVIHLKSPVQIRDLATELGLKPFQIIHSLMEMEVFASITQTLDIDKVVALCKKHGFVFEKEARKKGTGIHKVEVVVVPPPPPPEPATDELQMRAPIVTFMGHVDHGKTSLLDAIRRTRVASGEAGGITQHIGAYSVEREGQRITFLDTPGHAAFTSMRARGAKVTDIVVLVVAADDGLMPQTIEAINHAKAAKVPIIVAVNKIDLPSANADKVKGQLQERELTPEEWGGETICVEVSATKGTGVDKLLENIAIQAEILELKASPSASPRGTVIEAQIEPGRGPTATVIVQMGTLKTGQAFICGNFWGKVKSLFDDHGKPVKSAGISTPVKVLGFTGMPNAGEEFLVMDSERDARTLSEERLALHRTDKLGSPKRATLESIMEMGAKGQKKSLQAILKCDAQGSVEAISQALGEIESKKIDLKILHSAVGPISESDVLLATASNAVIVGFNVKTDGGAANAARREGVQIKLFSIIYELIDQIRDAMAEMLDPESRESVIGHATVKQVFDLSKGRVAGCYVSDGRISRTARARLLRDRQPIYDGGLATLKRFTDDVKEVRSGVECGIKLGDYSDYEEGDIIECYVLEKFPQKL